MEFAEYIKSTRIDKVLLKRRNTPYVEGTLCVTGHHLIFSSRTQHKEELFLLITGIEYVEKKFKGQTAILTICCKNFDLIKLKISTTEEALNLVSSIDVLSTIENQSLKYPFFYRHLQSLSDEYGWDSFSTDIEFSKVCASTQNWRISHVNSGYQVCPSYPTSVIVPMSISDNELKASAQFRQSGRFPVLSYFHKATGVTLVRAGQPLCGLPGKRCKEDEKMVNSALGTEKKGMIVDTRTHAAGINSRSKVSHMEEAGLRDEENDMQIEIAHPTWITLTGGGIEPESNYPQWKRSNQSIERYSTLNDSVSKLMEACYDPHLSMNSWLSRLESSGWLDHVQSVLGAACFVAQCLDKQGIPVLVHGDVGVDATLQVTSLAQVILEPDCRTVRGFEGLLDREWLRAGHPFADRCIKVGLSPSKYKGQGSVFLLFLDCVWQIYQQFPCSFEFNGRFLIYLYEHAYYSQYGTFLCNNERDRAAIKLKVKTISLWSYLNQDEVLAPMLNPMYERNDSVLWPSVAPQSLVLWSDLYLKWRKQQKNEETFWQEVRRIQNVNRELKNKAITLRREYAELQAKVLEERRKQQEQQKQPQLVT